MTNMTAIYAALLGSIAGGLAHYFLARRLARLRRGSVINAFVAEVRVLRDLLRDQFRPEPAPAAQSASSGRAILPLYYRGTLAAVYGGLSDRLGDLHQHQAEAIVRFHTLYKVAMAVADQRGAVGVDDALIDEILELGGLVETFRDPPSAR